MDLGAYAKIDDYGQIMRDNGISVPRLRGIRLMKEEKPIPEEEIKLNYIGLRNCEEIIRSGFIFLEPNGVLYSTDMNKKVKRYLKLDEYKRPVGVIWKAVHGRNRKMFKFALKKAMRRIRENAEAFNKYCGCDGVLYIHARIGGGNWNYYGGDEIAKQPWFIEKVDDPFDCTYCDIYARIKDE